MSGYAALLLLAAVLGDSCDVQLINPTRHAFADGEATEDEILEATRIALEQWQPGRSAFQVTPERARSLVQLFADPTWWRKASDFVVECPEAQSRVLPLAIHAFRQSLAVTVRRFVWGGAEPPVIVWLRMACLKLFRHAGNEAASVAPDVIQLLQRWKLEDEQVYPPKNESLLQQTVVAVCCSRPELVESGLRDAHPGLRAAFCSVASAMPTWKDRLAPFVLTAYQDGPDEVSLPAGEALVTLDYLPPDVMARARARLRRVCDDVDQERWENLISLFRATDLTRGHDPAKLRTSMDRAYEQATEEVCGSLRPLCEEIRDWQTWETPPQIPADRDLDIVRLFETRHFYAKAAQYILRRPDVLERVLPRVIEGFRASLKVRLGEPRPYDVSPPVFWVRSASLLVLKGAGSQAADAIPAVVHLLRMMALEDEAVHDSDLSVNLIAETLAALASGQPQIIVRGLEDPAAGIRLQYCIAARYVHGARRDLAPLLTELLDDPDLAVALQAGGALQHLDAVDEAVVARVQSRVAASSGDDQRDLERLLVHMKTHRPDR